MVNRLIYGSNFPWDHIFMNFGNTLIAYHENIGLENLITPWTCSLAINTSRQYWRASCCHQMENFPVAASFHPSEPICTLSEYILDTESICLIQCWWLLTTELGTYAKFMPTKKATVAYYLVWTKCCTALAKWSCEPS